MNTQVGFEHGDSASTRWAPVGSSHSSGPRAQGQEEPVSASHPSANRRLFKGCLRKNAASSPDRNEGSGPLAAAAHSFSSISGKAFVI
ncbi:hypothetical protein EJB05_01085, partial [Eragrostis curvula]